jgi:cob(I)alamin adenosyltransferase
MGKSNMPHQETKQKVGLIVVLTGNGKGKTTSAMGMALRAVGHKLRTCIIQFMKGGLVSGEIDGLKWLAPLVEFHLAGQDLCGIQGKSYPYREHRANSQCAIELAREKIHCGLFDIVILDEINDALKLDLVDLPQVLELLDAKPPDLQLVLTGRDAHAEVCRRAQTLTEMVEIKHAHRDGIEPQPGIDY